MRLRASSHLFMSWQTGANSSHMPALILWLASLASEGPGVLTLLEKIQQKTMDPTRLRLPQCQDQKGRCCGDYRIHLLGLTSTQAIADEVYYPVAVCLVCLV